MFSLTNSTTLVHALCVVLQLRNFDFNGAELQYLTQSKDKNVTVCKVKKIIKLPFY